MGGPPRFYPGSVPVSLHVSTSADPFPALAFTRSRFPTFPYPINPDSTGEYSACNRRRVTHAPANKVCRYPNARHCLPSSCYITRPACCHLPG